MCTCILRHLHECLHMNEVSRKMMMKYWGQMVGTVGQRAGVSPEHQSRLRIWETRRLEPAEAGPTPLWSIPLPHYPDITLPQLLPPLHCDPTPPIPCLFLLTVVGSSACSAAAGACRWRGHPLCLFSFIPFWKWIKCLSWKVCPDFRVLKFIYSRYWI